MGVDLVAYCVADGAGNKTHICLGFHYWPEREKGFEVVVQGRDAVCIPGVCK